MDLRWSDLPVTRPQPVQGKHQPDPFVPFADTPEAKAAGSTVEMNDQDERFGKSMKRVFLKPHLFPVER